MYEILIVQSQLWIGLYIYVLIVIMEYMLAEYDKVTHSVNEELCNVHFDDNSWSQAKLTVGHDSRRLHSHPSFTACFSVLMRCL